MNLAEAREKGAAIMTYTGKWAFPLDPIPDMIDINDIAQALSNQCRFSGHVKEFYSVAEHSCRVASYLIENEHPDWVCFWGLLHDASEAYLVDLARPIKMDPAFATRYREAEKDLMDVITTYYGLPNEQPEEVTFADQVLLSTEQRDLMPAGEVWYPEVPRIGTIKPWTPQEAKDEFLFLFDGFDLNRYTVNT